MIGERFGIYVHVSGSMNVVQLGFDKTDIFASSDLKEEIRRLLGGGGIKAERTSDELSYISLTAAYDEQRPQNAAASYFAGVAIFGDCIIVPKSETGYFGQKEAAEQCCLLHWQWRYIESRTKNTMNRKEQENGNSSNE